MPVTTFLHDAELNQPTGDTELDALLADVRAATNRDYQVVSHAGFEQHGFLGLRVRKITRTCLYVFVGGMGPWQWLAGTQTAAEVRAYLLGLLNGASERSPAPRSAADMQAPTPKIVCEHCPTQFHGIEEAAEVGGWISGWDGWECPAHAESRAVERACRWIDAIVADILVEHRRAVAKFPTWPTDPLHACGVVQEESGELAKAVLQSVYEPHKLKPGEVRSEAIQTAAMAIRFLVSFDAAAYDWRPSQQHQQASQPEVR